MTRYIGIDPGPTPGIVRLHCHEGRLVAGWTHVVQCSANVMPEILGAFLENGRRQWPRSVIQVERFVTRGRVSRDQRQTLDQASLVQSIAGELEVTVVLRNASQVKHWATDARLKAVQVNGRNLLEATTGMRHARDAARHALFAAVHDGGLPDPMSKEYHR